MMWEACIAHVADVTLEDSSQKSKSNMSFTGGLRPTDQENSWQLVARRGGEKKHVSAAEKVLHQEPPWYLWLLAGC